MKRGNTRSSKKEQAQETADSVKVTKKNTKTAKEPEARKSVTSQEPEQVAKEEQKKEENEESEIHIGPPRIKLLRRRPR
jgi:hypothetical protein